MRISFFFIGMFFSFSAFAGFTKVTGSSSAGKYDIIFVVDDSGSMTNMQPILSANVGYLLQEIEGKDAHVGVLTTSFHYSTAGVFLGKDRSGSFEEVYDELSKTLMVGTNGIAVARPFATVIQALNPPFIDSENRGFLRKGAKLVLVFITDADDESGYGPLGFYDALVRAKGDENIIIHGYLDTSESKVGCSNNGYRNILIVDLIRKTGGMRFDLCEKDWSGSVVPF